MSFCLKSENYVDNVECPIMDLWYSVAVFAPNEIKHAVFSESRDVIVTFQTDNTHACLLDKLLKYLC